MKVEFEFNNNDDKHDAAKEIERTVDSWRIETRLYDRTNLNPTMTVLAREDSSSASEQFKKACQICASYGGRKYTSSF